MTHAYRPNFGNCKANRRAFACSGRMQGRSVILASASGSCGALGAAALRIGSHGDVFWRVASYATYIVVRPPPHVQTWLPPRAPFPARCAQHAPKPTASRESEATCAGQHRRFADLHRRSSSASRRDCCGSFALWQHACLGASCISLRLCSCLPSGHRPPRLYISSCRLIPGMVVARALWLQVYALLLWLTGSRVAISRRCSEASCWTRLSLRVGWRAPAASLPVRP